MIICHCRAVTDKVIRTAVRNGARTRRQVGAACAANMGCGGCAPAIDEIIEIESECDAATGLGALPEFATAGG